MCIPGAPSCIYTAALAVLPPSPPQPISPSAYRYLGIRGVLAYVWMPQYNSGNCGKTMTKPSRSSLAMLIHDLLFLFSSPHFCPWSGVAAPPPPKELDSSAPSGAPCALHSETYLSFPPFEDFGPPDVSLQMETYDFIAISVA
ncbi:uncharacterized protein VTP21DRAFT_6223 [Calcarisporiella thermophila]|uniref:uncharacterized protein n=1 Tax=Calcarisporiella thermophila TaxID=911321 RepID=UPI003743893B